MTLTIGIFLLVFGSFSLKQKRKIEHTPTSKIRSLAMGLVEIKGTAKEGPAPSAETIPAVSDKQAKIMKLMNIHLSPNSSNISPFTKKKCVYYSAKIEEERGSGKNRHWVTIHANMYINPFYVQDDTGKILINPNKANLELKSTFEENSSFGKDPSKLVMDYLKENNIKFEGFLGMNKKMRYKEEAIFVNSEVYVIGEAMSSGKSSSVQHENIIIGKKGNWGMYHISNRPEEEILKRFNRTIYPLFIIGGIMIIISVTLMAVALFK